MDQAEQEIGFFVLGNGILDKEPMQKSAFWRQGSPKRYSKGIHQVIVSHIERHSKKPEEARKRIEQLMGDVPKIELFAREKADGWDTWGNEAPDGISIPELEVV